MAVSKNTDSAIPQRLTRRSKVADYLGLERNVLVISIVVFLIGTGEELWKKFLPKYMEALGAGAGTIGLFGTTKDFLDAVYQYPGGWLADHLGRRRAFLIFIALASVGYLIYLLSPSWPYLFAGLLFTMAWSSMASPAVFAVIGDSLPKSKRAMGFTVQSMLRRVPMGFAPLIGGGIIIAVGVKAGVRISLVVMLVLATATAAVLTALNVSIEVGQPTNIRGVWRSFHGALKRLLVSDIIIRTCEGMADIFVILYVTNITGITIAEYAMLVAVQMTTSILSYVPAAKIADRTGRKPFVIATFVCFAAFPLAVVMATSFHWLFPAFVIGGLREIGEPSRKAMIVDFAADHLRGRTVGLYYLVRSLTITPAASIGGLLWEYSPRTPFVVAGVIGLVGTIVFAAMVEERYAG